MDYPTNINRSRKKHKTHIVYHRATPRPCCHHAGLSSLIPGSLELGIILMSVLSTSSCGDTTANFLAEGPDVAIGNKGKVVGGPCIDETSCAMESFCLKDESFPKGICTRSCSIQEPCPSGAVCIAEKNGVCLVACAPGQECRAGYTCRKARLFGAEEEKLVCSGEE